MLFKRISRTSPEQVFAAVKNSFATASLTNGQAVIWDSTDADGVSVTKPVAGSGIAFAGIAAGTIAAGAYGLVQVYGYHSAVRVRSITSAAPAIAVDLGLACSQALFCLESMSTASTAPLKFPGAIALAVQASYTTKAIAAFIKAM